MKKYFFTGLVLLMPLALTILVVSMIIDWLTKPFLGMTQEMIGRQAMLGPDQLQIFVSRILILIVLFCFTVLLGFLTQWVFTRYFIRLSDSIFHRIPVFKTIYITLQDIFKTMFTSDANSFKQVVLVPYPNPNTYTLGLVTKEGITTSESSLIAVFVPTTPNPTSGFMLLFRPEDVTYLDMKVEDAFKCIISCGVSLEKIKIAREG